MEVSQSAINHYIDHVQSLSPEASDVIHDMGRGMLLVVRDSHFRLYPDVLDALLKDHTPQQVNTSAGRELLDSNLLWRMEEQDTNKRVGWRSLIGNAGELAEVYSLRV